MSNKELNKNLRLLDSVMATTSSTDYNLESSDTNSPLKKKYKRIRSRAYKKRRSNRRKERTVYKRKKLQRYLNHKSQQIQMSSCGKQMLDIPTSLVHEMSTRSHNNEETAFWKSKAISLQYENQMLYKHIEEMYTNMIISNRYTAQQQNNEELQEINEDYTEEIEDPNFNEKSRKFREERDKQRKLKEQQKEEEEIATRPPVKQDVKQTEEQLKQLYGSQWRKIRGMETVVQLNYDLILDKQKVNFWPIYPLKM